MSFTERSGVFKESKDMICSHLQLKCEIGSDIIKGLWTSDHGGFVASLLEMDGCICIAAGIIVSDYACREAQVL